MFDGKALGESIVAHVRGYVDSVFKRLEDRIASLPTPEKGEPGEKGDPGINGKDGAPGERGPQGERGEAGIPGERGEPGVQGEQGPQGAPGEKGLQGDRGEQGAQGERGEKGEPGETGPQGERGEKGDPGESIKGDPGRDGKDGRDGIDGRDAASIEPIASIDEAKSYAKGTWAKHKGGLWLARSQTDGMIGWDCVVDGIADAFVEPTEDLRVIGFDLRLSSGKSAGAVLHLPVLLDRGIFKAGENYEQGDVATWDGSMWIAQKATQDKPGTSDAWRLSVKRGRDGRDGLRGEKGERGVEGRPGKDLTQTGHDGSKW